MRRLLHRTASNAGRPRGALNRRKVAVTFADGSVHRLDRREVEIFALAWDLAQEGGDRDHAMRAALLGEDPNTGEAP